MENNEKICQERYNKIWEDMIKNSIDKDGNYEFIEDIIKKYGPKQKKVPSDAKNKEIIKLEKIIEKQKKKLIKLKKEKKDLNKKVEELKKENKELKEHYDRFDILDLG